MAAAGSEGVPRRDAVHKTVGSRNEHTHRHNLSTLLQAIHIDGSLSRAELTRRSKLSRSTVHSLVAELVDFGLVREGPARTATSAGRPSAVIHPHPDCVVVAVNPDVDAITVALVGLNGVVRSRALLPTPEPTSLEQAAGIAATIVSKLIAQAGVATRVVSAGVAVPGLVRLSDGVVVDAPHLGWKDAPAQQVFGEAMGLACSVANDASVGLLAEVRFGSGRGIDNVVYLNGSPSGIGGAAMVDGRLMRGTHGFAGEFGHMYVASQDLPCTCGSRGCLEAAVNVQRLERAAGVKPGHLDELELDAVLRTGGDLPAEIDSQLETLGRGIANLVSAFSPDVVILSGFLGALDAARPGVLLGHVRQHSFSLLARDLLIERALLRDDRVMIGAAEIAFAEVLRDPRTLRPA